MRDSTTLIVVGLCRIAEQNWGSILGFMFIMYDVHVILYVCLLTAG